MIKKIYVRNFSILRDISIEFDKGFNVITGETGAGKSLVVESVAFAFGGRYAFKGLKEPVWVKVDFADGKDIISIERIYEISGRSRYYINGKNAYLSDIEGMRERFIDFHSQMDNLLLTNNISQLKLLDRFAGIENIVNEFEVIYNERKRLYDSLNMMKLNEEEKKKLLELYRFQVEEIESLNLKEDEDAFLEGIISNYRNVSRINEMLNYIDAMLYGEDGIFDLASKCFKRAQDISSLDPRMKDIEDKFSEMLAIAQEIKTRIKEYISTLDVVQDIDRLIERDETIKNLKRKYKVSSVKHLIEYALKLQDEIKNLSLLVENVGEVERKILDLEKRMNSLAGVISKKRKEFAKNMSFEIRKNLKFLGLKNSVFDVLVNDVDDFNPYGRNSVEFLFSANPDQPLGPLRYVASGGEISRMMLAIKGVVRDMSFIPVMIFDEIDSGVGGNTAFKLGRFIKDISNGIQTICITHMPQIAIFADNHIKVEKKVVGKQTEVIVKRLKTDSDIIEEIARMFGSEYSTNTALAHARELFEKCRKEE